VHQNNSIGIDGQAAHVEGIGAEYFAVCYKGHSPKDE